MGMDVSNRALILVKGSIRPLDHSGFSVLTLIDPLSPLADTSYGDRMAGNKQSPYKLLVSRF